MVAGRAEIAVSGVVTLDHRTSSTTVCLKGQEDKRQATVDGIIGRLAQTAQAKLCVRPAGRESIDVSPACKAYAAKYLVDMFLPTLGFSDKTKVVIAGDDFGSGADEDMLHDSFRDRGTYVICVGKDMPQKVGFTIVKPAQAVYSACAGRESIRRGRITSRCIMSMITFIGSEDFAVQTSSTQVRWRAGRVIGVNPAWRGHTWLSCMS